MKKSRKSKKRKSYLFPIAALFTLCLSAVVTMLIAGGPEELYYLVQRDFIPNKRLVCIDPGHGGSSSGAAGADGTRLEKDDNLRLSLLVRDELIKRGYEVVMTRDGDADVSLEERCKAANRARASLFVSIHRNASESGRGMEMWVHSGSPTDDMLLAENLLARLEDAGISANRGIHSGYRDGADMNYYINKHTKMPSCLAEIGFITSDGDNKDFDEKISVYAEAIADGIESTLLEMNGE